jgi:hypothetical protein
MPVVNGRNVGFAQAANAAVNNTEFTGDILPLNAFTTTALETPQMTRLSFWVLQTSGVNSISVQPLVAFRRGNNNILTFLPAVPPVLTVPNVPTLITLNVLCVEAIALGLTNTGGAGNVSAQYALSGSG